MFRMLISAVVLATAVQVFSLGRVPQSEAKDLTDVLARGFFFKAPEGSQIGPRLGPVSEHADFSAAGRAIAPALSTAVAQAVTQEFPLASVAPAFAYRFNPTVDTYERLTGVPGPLFSERALTLGKGQLNFGVGYSSIEYSDIDGTPLNSLQSPGFFREVFAEPPMLVRPLPTGEVLVSIPVSLSRVRTRIDVNAHVIMPTLRYGITDRWDVSLALPIVSTFLRIRNEVVRTVDLATLLALGPQGSARFVDLAGNTIDHTMLSQFQFVKSQRPTALLSKAAGSATGVGDLTLRTKYQFWQSGFGGAVLGLNLQLPTGESRDFHGTDQTHLLTFLYLSQVLWERFEPHLNLGVDFNADDVDRSSFLYAVGGTLLVGAKLGVVVDFLGRSEFGRTPVRIRPEDMITGGILDRTPSACTTAQPCFIAGTVSSSAFPVAIKRNDIINFSFGLRYALGTSGSVFFGGIIPLNNDGFRADFIPSGGIEYTF